MSTAQKRRDLTVGVAAFFLLLWALLTHSHVNSWNDISRLATAEALVHHGAWAIDDTALGQRTGDRVFLNGHFYSDKPPVLSLLAAGVYAVLRNGLDLSLDSAGCDPDASPCYCFALLCPGPPDWAYYLLTLTLVGFPSALMLALFYRSTAFHDFPNPPALLLTGVLGLGTLILPYSLVFANHVPAAAGLMAGFYALLRSRAGVASSPRWLLVAGFATALAFTLDLSTGPFLASFLIYAVLCHRRRAWPFLLGVLLPLALMAGLDWWMLGDPLPPQMHAAGFGYPGSPFPSTPTGTHSAANVWDYALRMLLGDHGLFAFSPVLLWAVFALGTVLRQRDHRLRGEAVAVGAASLAVVLYFVLFTDNFGGAAYGPRWFTPMAPLLFFFAARPSLYHSVPRRLLFAALVALSFLSAWRGAFDPWGEALPPLRLETPRSAVGRYVEGLPAGAVVYATPPRVHHLPLFPAATWHGRLREFDAASGVLPAGDSDQIAVYVLQADDRATGDLLEAVFPHGRWDLITEGAAVYRVPPGVDRVRPQQPLRAVFGDQIELLGCDLPPESLRPGDTLAVRLYWRALAPMERGYTAFVHLLGPVNPATGAPSGRRTTISPATPPTPPAAGSLARWCWTGSSSRCPPERRPGSTC